MSFVCVFVLVEGVSGVARSMLGTARSSHRRLRPQCAPEHVYWVLHFPPCAATPPRMNERADGFPASLWFRFLLDRRQKHPWPYSRPASHDSAAIGGGGANYDYDDDDDDGEDVNGDEHGKYDDNVDDDNDDGDDNDDHDADNNERKRQRL